VLQYYFYWACQQGQNRIQYRSEKFFRVQFNSAVIPWTVVAFTSLWNQNDWKTWTWVVIEPQIIQSQTLGSHFVTRLLLNWCVCVCARGCLVGWTTWRRRPHSSFCQDTPLSQKIQTPGKGDAISSKTPSFFFAPFFRLHYFLSFFLLVPYLLPILSLVSLFTVILRHFLVHHRRFRPSPDFGTRRFHRFHYWPWWCHLYFTPRHTTL